MSNIKKTEREYFDLAYNAYSMLKEFYTYEEITWMPIRGLFDEIDKFHPKLKEIARRQEEARLKAELEGKKNNQRLQQQQHRGGRR